MLMEPATRAAAKIVAMVLNFFMMILLSKQIVFFFFESSWNPHKVNDPHGTYQYRDHRTVLPQGPEEHRTEDPSPE